MERFESCAGHGEKKASKALFTTLQICRLFVEQPSDKQIVLAAFCPIPDKEHRPWVRKSASFPLFALSATQLSSHQFSSLQDTLFLLLPDCLFVLLVVIKVHFLISS